jgi:outer membrane lipoprotein carrier protein
MGWLALVSTVALADTTAEIERYFAELDSLQAEFAQTVYDDQGRRLEQSSGRFYMQRPLRLRWDYYAPHEQLIVADGRRLWLYDPGLEQVTVQFLDQTLETTPLALLSGTQPLAELFTIQRLESRGRLQWYQLRPLHTEASEVSTLRLAFTDGELEVLEIEDRFRRRTRLALAEVQPNAELDPELFRFEPPVQADVVGDY